MIGRIQLSVSTSKFNDLEEKKQFLDVVCHCLNLFFAMSRNDCELQREPVCSTPSVWSVWTRA
jgi:hypothetical protein